MTERRSAPPKPRVVRKAEIINPLDGSPGVPGFYRTRLVKDGPFVPVALRHEPPRDPDTGEPMDRSYLWSLEIAGELVADPSPCQQRAFGRYVTNSNGWGLTGEVIDQELYEYMLRVREWAIANDPTAPEANPRQSVDLDRIPPLF